jgi:hypothetical protein
MVPSLVVIAILAVPAATLAEQPLRVTGTMPLADCAIKAQSSEDGHLTHRVGACDGSWSDPRLEGDVIWAREGSHVTIGTGKPAYRVDFGRWALSIENDEGAWRSEPVPFARIYDETTIGEDPMTALVLHGEGAYDGLVAVLRGVAPTDWEGYIIEGEVVPTPEIAFTDG